MLDRAPSQDKRVKYDPSIIVEPEGMLTSERRVRSRKGKALTGRQIEYYKRASGEISTLAKVVLEAISADDSHDEINELPPEVVFNIGNRTSQKPVFITNTPYRPNPAD